MLCLFFFCHPLGHQWTSSSQREIAKHIIYFINTPCRSLVTFANSASLPVRNAWNRNIWCPLPYCIGFTRFTATKSRKIEVIIYRVFTSSSIWWFLPLSNACSRERKEIRLARLLDSLVNLSVAALQHEVIALISCLTDSSLDLLIAGNRQVPTTITDHIPSLWVSLQELSADYRFHNQLSDESKSPPQPRAFSLPSAAKKRIKRFQRTALKFCGEKLNRRIVKHLQPFQAVNGSQSPPGSSFVTIQNLVQALANHIKARSTFSDPDWDQLWDGFKAPHLLNGKICWGARRRRVWGGSD